MKVVLCYISVTGGQRTEEFAARFASTYREHPPGYPHETIVVCNGGQASHATQFCLEQSVLSVPRGSYLIRQNDPGWDISAYIEVAKNYQFYCGMMLCLGESIHFHHAGWLARLVEAWEKHGPGMYGAFASNTIRAHINTTGFAIAPSLLASYPLPVNSKETRYEFEHGLKSIWRHVADQGKPAMLVTWDGFWHPQAWRVPTNILWRGNQRNCLFFCQHTDRYFAADQKRRRNWERYVDAPFR